MTMIEGTPMHTLRPGRTGRPGVRRVVVAVAAAMALIAGGAAIAFPATAAPVG